MTLKFYLANENFKREKKKKKKKKRRKHRYKKEYLLSVLIMIKTVPIIKTIH